MKPKATRNLLIILMFTAAMAIAADPPKPIPDTGQTKCYDTAGNEITCPSEGQALYGQDGNYVKERSYTVLQGGAIVQDNVTGLMWEVKTDDGGIHDRDNEYTWYDPDPATNGGYAGTESANDTKDFIDALNAEGGTGFGGYSDWRMPTLKELAGIVNLGKETAPRIDETYFPNTQSSYYWSSTTYASYTGYAWSMGFSNGSDSNSYKSGSYYVRAVREGQ